MTSDSFVVKMTPAGSAATSRAVCIPAVLCRDLPTHSEWELTVESDGFRLRYIGEYDRSAGRSKRRLPGIALPFLPATEGSDRG